MRAPTPFAGRPQRLTTPARRTSCLRQAAIPARPEVPRRRNPSEIEVSIFSHTIRRQARVSGNSRGWVNDVNLAYASELPLCDDSAPHQLHMNWPQVWTKALTRSATRLGKRASAGLPRRGTATLSARSRFPELESENLGVRWVLRKRLPPTRLKCSSRTSWAYPRTTAAAGSSYPAWSSRTRVCVAPIQKVGAQ